MVHIYVLRCDEDKYYVGKTHNKMLRMEQHFGEGGGCVWTRKYKPVEIVETFEGDKYDEDSHVLRYMEKYGIDNVRGGSYCQEILFEEQIESITEKIVGANDLCNNCGKSGHFIKDCKKKSATLNSMLKAVSELGERGKLFICDKCGRGGHKSKDCFAKTDVKGKFIGKPVICDKCKEPGHYASGCNVKIEKKIICFRCGRKDHYSSDCCAKTHIAGYCIEGNSEEEDNGDLEEEEYWGTDEEEDQMEEEY
jgi:hypothetical protein